MIRRKLQGFTLIELSIVLLVLSMLAAAGIRYSANATSIANMNALNNTLDVIETALQSYRATYLRLPCPANILNAENATTFGIEVDTSTIGSGLCTGGDLNSSDPDNDPDNISTNPFAPQAEYDSATAGVIAGGAVPTKTLKIDDKYAYDPWGRKLFFVVDARITATNAFTTYGANNTVIGGVVVKKTAADTLANAYTYKGVYAIVSFGPDGHGGFVRNVEQAPVAFNSGNTNTDTMQNCHCDSSLLPIMFDRVFVQKNKVDDSTSLTKGFDDIVRYKTRAQMAIYSELQ